jgi:hypothetical protein
MTKCWAFRDFCQNVVAHKIPLGDFEKLVCMRTIEKNAGGVHLFVFHMEIKKSVPKYIYITADALVLCIRLLCAVLLFIYAATSMKKPPSCILTYMKQFTLCRKYVTLTQYCTEFAILYKYMQEISCLRGYIYSR